MLLCHFLYIFFNIYFCLLGLVILVVKLNKNEKGCLGEKRKRLYAYAVMLHMQCVFYLILNAAKHEIKLPEFAFIYLRR